MKFCQFIREYSQVKPETMNSFFALAFVCVIALAKASSSSEAPYPFKPWSQVAKLNDNTGDAKLGAKIAKCIVDKIEAENGLTGFLNKFQIKRKLAKIEKCAASAGKR